MEVQLLPNPFVTIGKRMEQFSSYINILWDAVDRRINLDIEYPSIFNRVMRFYESRKTSFYGDVDENYDILLTKLEKDLVKL